jgi:hypothetical protein
MSIENDSHGKSIESRVVAECRLSTVALPRRFEDLGPHCVAQCPHLTDLSFESQLSLHQMCDSAFLPSSLISLCLRACVSSMAGSSLVTASSISIEGKSVHLSVDSSFLYDMRCSTITHYYASCTGVSIPIGVEIFGGSTFYDSKVR